MTKSWVIRPYYIGKFKKNSTCSDYSDPRISIFNNGIGSLDSPFLICNNYQFNLIQNLMKPYDVLLYGYEGRNFFLNSAYQNNYIELGNSLSFQQIKSKKVVDLPINLIGTYNLPFMGTFFSAPNNLYKISDINISLNLSQATEGNIGLFRRTLNAHIYDLTLENIRMGNSNSSCGSNFGIVVGDMNGRIENISVIGSQGGTGKIGGPSVLSMYNCSNVGGIMVKFSSDENPNSFPANNLKYEGVAVLGKSYVGGIVGLLTNSIQSSNVNILLTLGEGLEYVGGIIGASSGNFFIDDVHFTGPSISIYGIKGDLYVGGISGGLYGSVIQNSSVSSVTIHGKDGMTGIYFGYNEGGGAGYNNIPIDVSLDFH